MADAVRRHDHHDVGDGVAERAAADVARHQIGDGKLGHGAAVTGEAAHDVALGNDPMILSVASVTSTAPMRCWDSSLLVAAIVASGSDGRDPAAFGAQNIAYIHKAPPLSEAGHTLGARWPAPTFDAGRKASSIALVTILPRNLEPMLALP